MSSVRRFSSSAALALVVGVGLGCVSPTLPLPPPEEPEAIEPSAEGLWRIRGTCAEGALVTVLNEATGAGVVVEDRDGDGTYVVELEAEECDLASVSQADEEGPSAETTFVIVEKAPGDPGDPAACN